MLKQRLLTAAVLIPLVFAAILLLDNSLFRYLLAVVVILAAIEWFGIIGFTSNACKVITSAVLVISLIASQWVSMNDVVFTSITMWAGIALFTIIYAHKALSPAVSSVLKNKLIAFLLASLLLCLFWLSAVNLHNHTDIGPRQLLYVMVLVWLADTGGYFAGKRWGKTALAKAMSPNKSWEGVAGAVVLSGAWMLIAFSIGLSGQLTLAEWAVLSLITLLISIVGDLFESVFKRLHDIKDSGNLLPGHGGMLDRIDSLIAAVPVFTAGIYLLGAS